MLARPLSNFQFPLLKSSDFYLILLYVELRLLTEECSCRLQAEDGSR